MPSGLLRIKEMLKDTNLFVDKHRKLSERMKAMSYEFQKRLFKVMYPNNERTDAIDSISDLSVYLSHYYHLFDVVAYRYEKETKYTPADQWKVGIVVPSEEWYNAHFFLHIINEYGFVEKFGIPLNETPEDIDISDIALFGDLDENLVVLSHNDTFKQAFESLQKVVMDGNKVLEEI